MTRVIFHNWLMDGSRVGVDRKGEVEVKKRGV